MPWRVDTYRHHSLHGVLLLFSWCLQHYLKYCPPCYSRNCSAIVLLILIGRVLESPAEGSVPPLGWRIGINAGGEAEAVDYRPQGVLQMDCPVDGPHSIYKWHTHVRGEDGRIFLWFLRNHKSTSIKKRIKTNPLGNKMSRVCVTENVILFTV